MLNIMNEQNSSNLKNVIMREYMGDIDLYLGMRSPISIRVDIIKSFNDFMKGNIDLDFEGQVFLNSYFMSIALMTCQNKYDQSLIRSKSEEELLKHPEYNIPEKIIKDNLNIDQVILRAYDIIMNALNKICDTGDLKYINEIAQECTGLAFDKCIIDYYDGY